MTQKANSKITVRFYGTQDFGNWRKGEAITAIAQLSVGLHVVSDSKQFDAANLCEVTKVDSARGIAYAKFVDPLNPECLRVGADPEGFAIWEHELQSGARSYSLAFLPGRNAESGKKILFSNIQWDTAGRQDPSLPEEVELDVGIAVDVDLEGADVLSDRFGHCVKSFSWKLSNHIEQLDEELALLRAMPDAVLLAEINRRGMLQPLYGAIGAMHDHLDRTGALDEHLSQYLAYRLRREEAAITGMPDSAASVANWQECIEQLDREARAVKVEDSPSLDEAINTALGAYANNTDEAQTPVPRVLVFIKGGVAESVSDKGVDVHVFDWDYNNDPDEDVGVPVRFADLAESCGVPVDHSVSLTS